MAGQVDIGLIAAMIVGVNAPTNTKLIWYDTNTNTHKVYDTGLSQWVILGTGNTPSIALKNVLIQGNTTEGNPVFVSNGDSIILEGVSGNARIVPPTQGHPGGTDLLFLLPINGGGTIAIESFVTLKNALANSNITDGNDIQISDGDVIEFLKGAFKGVVQIDTLTENVIYTLPPKSGTFAMLSDVQAADELQEVLSKGNITGTNDIIFSSTRSAKFESDTDSYNKLAEGDASVANYIQIIKVGTRILAGNYDGFVYEYDESLNFIQAFTLPDGAWHISYNSSLQRLYVGDWNGGSNTRYIDLSTDTVVTVASGNTGYRDAIDYNPFTGKIYAYDYSSQQIDIYDNGYLFESSINMPAGFNGYVITTNKQNGKIYVGGNDGADAKVLAFDSAGTLLSTITYAGNSYDLFDVFGSDYNTDLNVAYVAIDDFIAVIDGDTNSQITTIDLSSYGEGAESVRYSNGEILVTAKGNVSGSSEDKIFLTIDSTTYVGSTITTLGGSTSNSGFIIYDNSHYYLSNDPVIEKWDDEKTFKTVSVKSIGTQKENFEQLLQAKSGTIALISDLPDIGASKVIWVDGTDGNDTTGVAYDFQLKYATVNAALTAGSSGDTIVVLPSTYSGTNTLKDGVNIHYMSGCVSSSQHEDNSTTVNCKITGDLIWSGSGRMFDLRGANTNVYCEVLNITDTSSDLMILNPGINPLDFFLKVKENVSVDFSLGTFRGGCNVTFDISGDIITNETGSVIRVLDLRDNFTGNLTLNCRDIYLADNGDNICVLFQAFSVSSGAKVEVNANDIISTVTTPITTNVNEAIIRIEQTSPDGRYVMNINRIKTENRSGFISFGIGNIDHYVEFNNTTFEITDNYCVRITKSFMKSIFNNCTFIRKSDGSDDNYMIGIGSQASVIPDLFNGQTDNFFVEFNNCKIIKESVGTDNTGLIWLGGANSEISFRNSDIVGDGTGVGSVALDAENVSDGNVYFKNTNSNLDNSANITDTAVVSGFIGLDTNLKLLY